jgi:putative toxin-antitoxin system antitoxin component (TIGR02293 family)
MKPISLPDLTAVPLDQLDGTRLLDLAGTDAVPAIRAGLSAQALERLGEVLNLSVSDLAPFLGIPHRTLTRRRERGRLTPGESDRLLRLARIVEFALAVFEDPDATRAWLTEPNGLLGDESPLAHADTAPGAHRIEDLLYAIEFNFAA